jgi:hypothetical protein
MVMSRRILFAFSVAALFVASGAVAKGPIGTIKVGNWTGGAYTNDVTGAFSHCAAGAPYLSGIVFLVSLDVSGGWTLGFVHQSWQLQHSPKVLSRAETPVEIASNGAVWRADEATGFVRIVAPQNNVKG